MLASQKKANQKKLRQIQSLKNPLDFIEQYQKIRIEDINKRMDETIVLASQITKWKAIGKFEQSGTFNLDEFIAESEKIALMKTNASLKIVEKFFDKKMSMSQKAKNEIRTQEIADNNNKIRLDIANNQAKIEIDNRRIDEKNRMDKFYDDNWQKKKEKRNEHIYEVKEKKEISDQNKQIGLPFLIKKKQEIKEEKVKNYRTFEGDGEGYDTRVNFQTEVYGSGKIDVNLRLTHFHGISKKIILSYY